MTTNEQKNRVKKLVGRFDDVNTLYIRRVAARIAHIATLDLLDLDIMAILFAINAEIAEINARASRTAQKAVPELYKLYQDDLNATYHGGRYSKALKEHPLRGWDKEKLTEIVQGTSKRTAEKMMDLAESTAVSSNYRRAVDAAVLAVKGNYANREQVIRQLVRDVGYKGLQTQYASGQRRRMSVAISENVSAGLRELRQQTNDYLSAVLWYDAKEISAHPNSAPDHEPVQGRVFSLREFENLQNHLNAVDVDGRRYPAMERAIGELNCKHIAYGFSTKYNKRRYTNEELDSMAQSNADGCQIGGKHYSIYEARQLVRRMDAEEERLQGVVEAAQAARDKILENDTEQRLKGLQAARMAAQSVIERNS